MKPLGVAALAALLLAGPAFAQLPGEGDWADQQRGGYLARVGDCVACHTAQGGPFMAGGRPLETPFGTIYTPNITPDPQTGIGTWSAEQFYRAMHKGVGAHGQHLYPAFPYPWFTKVTREDVNSIYAYLRTLPPVQNRPPANALPWPLDIRTTVSGWNLLFFSPGTFKPDAGKSAEWNRGAYLVEGLAHCGACHSGKNFLGAVEDGPRYQGAELQHWFAPNLTSDERSGLGQWSADEIVQFLKTGRTDRTVAYGPMAQVVHDSTSKLDDADLNAMAVYLKGLSGGGGGNTASRPAQDIADAGSAIYADSCSACHREQGEGVPGLFPALKGSAVVQSSSATTVVRLILNGGHAVSTAQAPTGPAMPSYDWKLSDQEIAAVASFVRSAWGNQAAPVASNDVHSLRSAVRNASSDD